MVHTQNIAVAICLLSMTTLLGCVGPNAHGPLGGCEGPLVVSNCSDCTGCGELYIDPWINHPADCVDPCDMCGNYNGQSCGRCRPMFEGIRSLWGYRCGDCGPCDAPGCEIECGCGALSSCGAEVACGCDAAGDCSCGAEIIGPSCGCDWGDPCCGSNCGGCSSCSGGETVHQDEGEIIYEGEYLGETHNSSSGVVEIDRADKPFKPERTRKIFNPRPRVATGNGRSVGY